MFVILQKPKKNYQDSHLRDFSVNRLALEIDKESFPFKPTAH
jgi:hypothetical protein